MDKKIIITNRNRDGAPIWFTQVKDNCYKIETSADKEYIFEYASYNYDKLPDDADVYDFEMDTQYGHVKGKTISFDPSGGPYIAIDDVINGYKINRIYNMPNENGIFFDLEKIN